MTKVVRVSRGAPHSLPVCPRCKLPPYRAGRGDCLEVADVAGLPDDSRFTVCMHCSGIWALEAGAWREPTAAEREAVMPILGPVAQHFALMRARIMNGPTAGSA